MPKDHAAMMERLVGALRDEEVTSVKQRWSTSPSSPLRIGTVCSGTDAPILALENILSVLNNDRDGSNHSENIQMEHVFSCEHVKFKRDFITETTNPPLLFNDVIGLASGKGTCHDGEIRDVPRDFHVLVAGTECVDFSSLSTTRKGLKGGGRSDATFWATHELAKLCNPAIVILENVAKCPAKEMKRAFEDIGYIAAYTKVCTSDYLLPQSRSRAYFVFIHRSKARFVESHTADDWIDTMQRLGSKRSRQKEDVLGWKDFLHENNAAKRSNKKKGRRGKPLSESMSTKWLAEIVAIEKKEGLAQYNAKGGRPYSDATKNVEALASLPDRAKMRLDVQCKRAMQAGIDPLKVPLLWNPAQQLRFTDAGFNANDGKPRPIAPCVTPKHEWIISSRKGPLTGPEALALQGIYVPEKVLSQFECGQLRDLAGNAMSTMVVAAAFLATFLTTELIDGESSLIDEGSSEKRSASAMSTRGTKTKRSRTC